MRVKERRGEERDRGWQTWGLVPNGRSVFPAAGLAGAKARSTGLPDSQSGTGHWFGPSRDSRRHEGDRQEGRGRDKTGSKRQKKNRHERERERERERAQKKRDGKKTGRREMERQQRR